MRHAVVALALLGAVVVLLPTVYLSLDSPSRAAAQWSDAVISWNTSAALARTCQRMQGQVLAQQQLSAQVNLMLATLAIPGARLVPGFPEGFQEVERSGAYARVVVSISYEFHRPIPGTNAAVSRPEDRGSIAEYWNMTREGWGPSRWKWCGYGGLVK